MDQPILHLSLPVDDLAQACAFYVSVFGSPVGRRGPDWCDVWFFGMQLTLQIRPDEVMPSDQAGVRHFGVVLPNEEAWQEVVDRAQDAETAWPAPPTPSHDPVLAGKLGGKLADPSGNVIEVKCYPNPTGFLAERPR
jgi:uncharacterized protein